MHEHPILDQYESVQPRYLPLLTTCFSLTVFRTIALYNTCHLPFDFVIVNKAQSTESISDHAVENRAN